MKKLGALILGLLLALPLMVKGQEFVFPPATSGLPNVSNNLQVNLQASTPGTAQTGHLNITGTAIAGAFSGPLTGAVTGNASTASSLANGGYLLTGGTTTTSTPTPAVGAVGQPVQYELSALGGSCTWGAPTGTPQDGQVLKLRVIDNGSAQTMAWTTSAGGYHALTTSPGALPTTTPGSTSHPLYISFTYNGATSLWDFTGEAY